VEALIQLGADVKAASASGFTPLVFAAVKNDAKSVAALVRAGADPNYTLPSGNKTLVVASSMKSVAAVNALVLAGADPNVVDSLGNTPLHEAAQAGNIELVANLLKKGATVDVRTPAAPAGRGGGGVRRVIGEQTALHLAVNAKHLEVVRLLAKSGADPLRMAQGETTLLMLAAASGSPAMVRYVFENLDPRIEAVSTAGSTVMHSAVQETTAVATQKEICEIVQYLAEHGAKLDEVDGQGRTPLQIATRGSIETAATLLAELIQKSGKEPKK
jgi:cytohesin